MNINNHADIIMITMIIIMIVIIKIIIIIIVYQFLVKLYPEKP